MHRQLSMGFSKEAVNYDADVILIGGIDKDSVSNLVDKLLRRGDYDVSSSMLKTILPRESILIPIVVRPDENRLQILAIMS